MPSSHALIGRDVASGLALVLLATLAHGCSESHSTPEPDPVARTELTAFIETVNAHDRIVSLGMGPPIFDAHISSDASITGIDGFAAIEDRLRSGFQLKARARFVGDFTYNAEATSLDVLEVTPGSRWHWRTPLTFRLSWHGWVLMGPDKHYYWFAPWTTFGADSDYRTLDELKALQSVCADLDATQILPDGVGYRVTSATFHRSATDCSQAVGTPMQR